MVDDVAGTIRQAVPQRLCGCRHLPIRFHHRRWVAIIHEVAKAPGAVQRYPRLGVLYVFRGVLPGFRVATTA